MASSAGENMLNVSDVDVRWRRDFVIRKKQLKAQRNGAVHIFDPNACD